MESDDIDACREWLEQVVAIDCRAGLYDLDNIAEAIDEIIGIELGEERPELYAEYVEKARIGLLALASDERGWSSVTMNDRIDAAFDDLNQRGIVAVQALGNTLQDGQAIAAQMSLDREETGDEPGRGYVFYHRQDLERAIRGEGLMIAFGPWDTADDEVWDEFGREVVHVLHHYGVQTTWGGDSTSRIAVEPFTWRKRMHTTPPEELLPAPPLPPKPQPEPTAVCAICGGRGWVPREHGGGSELCTCQRSGS